MKRIIYFIFIICSLLALYAYFVPVNYDYAIASSFPSYAIINEGCSLYKDPLCESRIVQLAPTYFVSIVSENTDSYEVGYLDLNGFVKKETVSLVDYTPKNKYPISSTAKAYNDGNTVTLRAFPDHTTSNSLYKLADGETVTYYGEVVGSIQIEPLGNKWYYVRTNGDMPVYGYVYSLYLSPPDIPANDTSAEEVPTMSEIGEQSTLEENGKYILIIALCIPILILMFIIFKNSKKNAQD